MRVKVEMNSKGEVKAHRIEIPIQGGGGELGQHAVTGLVSLISGLKEMKTERELEQLLSMVYGWGACCKHCGFLTEKSTDDVMHMAEELAEIESKRIEKETGEAGLAPITPHLYMTQCMDDKKLEERARGMAAGLALQRLRFCYCGREIRHNRGNGQRNTYSKYAGNCGYRCEPD